MGYNGNNRKLRTDMFKKSSTKKGTKLLSGFLAAPFALLGSSGLGVIGWLCLMYIVLIAQFISIFMPFWLSLIFTIFSIWLVYFLRLRISDKKEKKKRYKTKKPA